MCIGIPMQVERVEGTRAWCCGRSGAAWIDLMLVGGVRPGDWLLTYLGAAREVLDPVRAHAIADALSALDAVLSGDPSAASSVDAAFADLIEREPQLPPHLRKPH
ncbi:MAG: HypC/HybG/HupF family hydrogenase formation chaperone [Nevskiales bacterium]|nr:HypC/HybG/HupF family hydrogenase formation chaperone [Nevskiales bacterium]